MPLTGPLVPLTKIQLIPYRTLGIGTSDPTKYRHRHPRSSLMPWSRSGRRFPRTPSADSSGTTPRCCWESIQAGGGHTHYWVTLWVAKIKFTQVGSACHFNFLLWFSVWFWIQHSVGWWFWFPMTIVMLFCSQQIIQCTLIKIVNLNNSFIKIWCFFFLFFLAVYELKELHIQCELSFSRNPVFPSPRKFSSKMDNLAECLPVWPFTTVFTAILLT